MIARFSRSPQARALVALLAVIALGCVFHQEGAFFRWSTHRDMLREIAVYGILSCGMTLVILSGRHRSRGEQRPRALGGELRVLTIPLGWGAGAAIAAVLAVGLAAGAASGALIARFRLQPFIVTLAMMVFARGLAKRLSGGKKVTAFTAGSGSGGLPRIFDLLDARVLGGDVAIVTLVFLGCVAVTWLCSAACGSAAGSTRSAATPRRRASRASPWAAYLLATYALSGLFAAVAGHLPGRAGDAR